MNEAGQQFGNYIDDGWSIDFLSLGHYGGFTDCIPDPDKTDTEYLMHFCHDCCLKMVATFPNAFGKHLGNLGCHPGDLEKPSCCEYAWTWDKNNTKLHYQGDGAGGWVLVRTESD